MRLSTSNKLDERLYDIEDRMEMLTAAVDAMSDYDRSGPPSKATMRGLAATLEELKDETHAIIDGYIAESNAAHDREHPELAKLIARVRGPRKAAADVGGAR